jgi:uncharacterized protein YjbI with pentapeptide repeats
MAPTRQDPHTVEAPRLPAELTPVDDGAFGDDAVLDGVVWSDGGPEEGASDVEVAGSRLSAVRFTGLELDQLRLVDVAVEDCELSGVTLSAARCERVTFDRCRMSGLVAPGLRATHARFAGCKLDGAWLRAAVLDRCELVECDLSGADLYEARLTRCRLLRCTLDGAELSAATFEGVALHGSTVDGVRGGASLRNVVIGSDQIVPVALAVFGARGIRVDDDYPDGPQP